MEPTLLDILISYSFTHFGYGLLSYYAFGTLDQPEMRISSVQNRKYPFLEFLSQTYQAVTKNLGLLASLTVEFLFEIIENSEQAIAHFRQHSGKLTNDIPNRSKITPFLIGTSELYIGDSSVNVVGDIIAVALGYYVAQIVTLAGYPMIPMLIYILTELFLAFTIRDNFTLVILSLVYPIDWVRKWQAEIIPSTQKSDHLSEIQDQEAWLDTYSVPKKSRKYKKLVR